MIIATGTLNIDENAKLAQQASAKVDTAGEKFKSTLDGKITTSSQAPFNDGKDHSNGDIWYVQDSDHNTTAMYTYDGSSWSQTKMTTSTLSVGQLSALTADLGTVNSGYIESVNISGSYITESSSNGTISLTPSGFSAVSGSSSFTFNSNNGNGYSVLKGGLDADGIQVHGGNPSQINCDGQIQTATQSMTSGSVFACSSGALYFENNISAGSGLIDIHSNNDYSSEIMTDSIHSKSGNSIYLYSPISINNGGEIISASNGISITQNKVYGLYGQFNTLEKGSLLSIKKNVENIDSENALNQILCSQIVTYNYKDQDNTQRQSIGPIIDDESKLGSKKYGVSNSMLNETQTGLRIDNEVGLLMGAVQELSKRNSELSLRLAKLERKVNNE